MLKFIGSGVAAVALASSAAALPGWTDPLGSTMVVTCGFMDPNYYLANCMAGGKPDSDNDKRQHVGTDFRASANTPVRSPVDGSVVTVVGGVAEASLIVIRESNGAEHVLGHISSSVGERQLVRKGDQVGTVKLWITASGQNVTHFHWGYNIGGVGKGGGGVASARGIKSGCIRPMLGPGLQSCPWGWGRIPFEATRADAVAAGWRPVL